MLVLWREQKQYEEVNFLYNGKHEKYHVCTGMPVMATQNIKNREIFNTMEFGVEHIVDGEFCVKNNWFIKDEFERKFYTIVLSDCLQVSR